MSKKMTKEEVKAAVKEKEFLITLQQGIIAQNKKNRKLYNVTMMVAAIMTLTAIPAAYAVFGESGLFMGMLIMVITSVCGFMQWQLLEELSDSDRAAKHSIRVFLRQIEHLQKWGEEDLFSI